MPLNKNEENEKVRSESYRFPIIKRLFLDINSKGGVIKWESFF